MKPLLMGTLLAALAAAGCCESYLLVQAPAVSMSIRSSDGQAAVPLGPVAVRYCQGDKPISSQTLMVGMMDEAIAKAQQQTGASYISDARFTVECACMVLEGTAMRLGPGAPPPQAGNRAPARQTAIVDARTLARSVRFRDPGGCHAARL